MTDIYEQHRAAFNNVSAYVITNRGKYVGTIAFKFPRDGAGRLYAYVHFLGIQMVRGYAGGGGYDKRSAACSDAAKKMLDGLPVNRDWPVEDVAAYDAFRAALSPDDGYTWDSRLQRAGFAVMKAV